MQKRSCRRCSGKVFRGKTLSIPCQESASSFFFNSDETGCWAVSSGLGGHRHRRLDALADDFAALGRRLKNTHIVTQHGVFDYLARDMGLTVVAVVQSEDTQMPSAAEMLQLIKTIKETQAGAIFTEPQYPDKIAAMLSRETGVPTAKLDPVATGPANAAPDYYETVMRDNLRTLEATLGVH